MKVLVTGGSDSSGVMSWRGSPRATTCWRPPTRELELTDADAVRVWLGAHPVDAVVHAAVKPGHRNAADPTSLLTTTCAVLRSAALPGLFGRLVVVGSGAAYGVQRPLARVVRTNSGEVVPGDEHGFSKYVEGL